MECLSVYCWCICFLIEVNNRRVEGRKIVMIHNDVGMSDYRWRDCNIQNQTQHNVWKWGVQETCLMCEMIEKLSTYDVTIAWGCDITLSNERKNLHILQPLLCYLFSITCRKENQKKKVVGGNSQNQKLKQKHRNNMICPICAWV